MTRTLSIVLGLVVFLTAALLVGPSFVDWNKYKPEIIAQAKIAAGYDIKIDGDIKISVLPSPRAKIEGLSVAAPRGQEPVLLNMKQAEVVLNILPLITGNISIDTIRFVNPNIQLEKLVNGQNSWISDKLSPAENATPETEASETPSTSQSTQNVAFNKIVIEDGRVAYVDRSTGKTQTAEKINLDLKADTLKGPFDVGGSLVYGGKTVELEAKTKVPKGSNKETDVDATISLPEANAFVDFGGVVAMEPIEVQGQVEAKADNLASVIALFTGGEPSKALSKKLEFKGLVTANDDIVNAQDMDVTFGDAKGKGGIKVSNIKEQNPAQLDADLVFEGTINLDQLAPKKEPSQKSVEERVAKGEKLTAKSTTAFIPETLSLPMPIDANIRINAEGIQSGGKVFKGLTLTATKTGPAIDITAKFIEIPGKTSADAKGLIRFGSTSNSGKGVTYADPSVTFTVVGSSEQLPTLLRALAPEQDKNAALEIWKAAQFNLNGSVTPDTVNLRDSTLKLDNTTVAVAASYKPDGKAGRPDVMIDLTTDTIDIDYIQSRLNGQKTQAVQKDATAKADVKKALEPVRGINVPVNLTFDLSAQKAIYNAQPVTGVRIKGRASGNQLSLDVASAQDYMGATASLKGTVANLEELSGVDLQFYGKTSDVKALMTSFKMDTSKLPQQISGAEATISAKGKSDDLDFKASVQALQGELEASGKMIGLLDKPTFSNLTIGAKHPNLVKAIQIMNPAFTGGPGLERPFTFDAKAVKEGDAYTLSDMKTTLGTTSITGALKVATGGTKSSVSGTIDAGTIPLDDLLSAKKGGTSSSSSGGSGGSSDASGGKWSRNPIETGWMHSVDMDLALTAQAITYGGWNLTKPTTKITLKDGNLNVDNLQAGLFGGTANLNAKVQDPADPKQPLSLAINSKMDGVALEPLVYAMSGSNRLQASGDVSLDFDVQSTGLSPYALVSALKGKANLNGTSVVLEGFDLSQLALAFVDTGKPLDRLNSLVGGAVSGGQTRFDTIKGAYNISEGIVNISSMVMDGPAANIVSTGNVNLPQWTIDTIHAMTLKQAKEEGAFNVAIKGFLSSPGNTFGKAMFNDIITRRAQQKVMEKLPDLVGDKLGDKLQGLGILPKKAAPTPAPTTPTPTTPVPAPDAVAPAPEAQQMAPAPVQEEPQSTEEQFKEDPEKAIKGVLDGLLAQ